ncbi:CIA30 family protein [Maribacter sp. 2307ULW6-5]|uniref:CIA30 family protein n=1 Tax=Maribacter sp. 2307ULW6-5 TaxID=3386275 RepID=UPI0039BD7892
MMGTTQEQPYVLFDAQTPDNPARWYVVNDGVMGGVSEGKMELDPDGHAHFSGTVRLENNGGFSSVRHRFEKRKVGAYQKVVLRLKGDGKAYQFRIKSDSRERFSYIQHFETTGEWETISLPFHNFYPGFRGYRLDLPNYAGEQMEEIAFLIGNKKKESFSLTIAHIHLE